MSRQSDLVLEMIKYEEKDTHRINHFLKVYAFAKTIGEGENLNAETQEILETAALVHDIGIRPSMKEFGNSYGPNQERLGMEPARNMLSDLGYGDEIVERVVYLVGHHHTYKDIDGMDYQALVEADFLVNLKEGNVAENEINSVRERIFKTGTGLKLLDLI